jgi:hypothetical protein
MVRLGQANIKEMEGLRLAYVRWCEEAKLLPGIVKN